MGKDIDNLSARLNSPVHFAGQLIQGVVHFDCSKPVKSEGVFVELIGQARVHWTEQESVGTGDDRRTETRNYTSHETYVQQKVCLYNPPDGHLPPGTYDIPFTLQLPCNVPSSFVGHHGRVMYKIVYNVHRPWKMAKKKVIGLSVCSVSDLNYVPEARNSITVSNEKTFGVLMFKSKPLSMEINLNKTGFVPGETIYLNGFIDNKSNTKIKHCEIKLYQRVIYYAGGKSRAAGKLIQELQQPGLEEKSAKKWVNVAFHVPSSPPTGLDGCHIINLSYHLHIRVVPPGMHFALEVDVPVFIGNVPLRDVAMPAQPQIGYPQQMPGQGGAGYPPQQMPGQPQTGFVPQQMPGQGGAGYPPQMPGQGGAGYPPQQMPGQGGAGYPPQQMPGQGGAGYPPQQMPGQGGAGYPPLPMFPGQDPSAPVMTMGAPPSYDEVFKVQHSEEDHEDYEFTPQYPTYDFSKEKKED